ncbi:class I SAM-dependent methyltransferase [Primorskyibacter flagellatus]|uniref:class I SAM-dependent methyltransferase n=1 Tax=Primorskyibacter flagellatus TaxID=1387277 RepID=UPI003A8CDC9D
MTDDKTLGVYDEKAGDYARLMDHDALAPTALNKFLSALPERGTVLDLGCGPGSWARYMVKAGFRVDAIDASAGMVEKASAIEGLTSGKRISAIFRTSRNMMGSGQTSASCTPGVRKCPRIWLG